MYEHIPKALWFTYAAIIGLCFGSFANVLVYRLPRKLSVVRPPSACPACGKRLRLWAMIPIVSWLFLRRRCCYCGIRISVRYPLVEMICAILFVGMIVFVSGLSVIPLSFFAFILLCITLIDWEIQEIPDGLIIAGTAVGFLWVAAAFFAPNLLHSAPNWHEALLGVLAGGLPLLVLDRISLWLLKKDGFGYGDVKLMAMAGLFLGWQLIFAAFFFAFITAGCYAAFLLLSGRAKRGAYIAFGPFLCAGSLFALWFGAEVIGVSQF